VNDQAMKLNPSSSFAHRNAGIISHRFDRDWTKARIEFERGVQLDPNGYSGRASQADLEMVDESLTGSVDRSISVLRTFLLDDPINVNFLTNLAYDLQFAGRYSESIETWRRLLSYYPNTDEVRSELVKTLILAGDVARAGQEAERETSKAQQCLETAFVEAARLHHALAEHALSCAIGNVRAYQVADFYAYIGDRQSAFYWLKQAYSILDPNLDSLPTDPFFRSLRDDDRYREILKLLRIAT
jgi:tetratricopeptide (TPR) repeat protein